MFVNPLLAARSNKTPLSSSYCDGICNALCLLCLSTVPTTAEHRQGGINREKLKELFHIRRRIIPK